MLFCAQHKLPKRMFFSGNLQKYANGNAQKYNAIAVYSTPSNADHKIHSVHIHFFEPKMCEIMCALDDCLIKCILSI